jgi:hypothetical protein
MPGAPFGANIRMKALTCGSFQELVCNRDREETRTYHRLFVHHAITLSVGVIVGVS